MPAQITGINNAIKNIEKKITDKHRKIMFDLDYAVVLATPRDTGRAKGNWIAAINTPSRIKTKQLGKTNNAPQIYKINKPCISYLSNNLPYIERLNNGWSKTQQPKPKYIQRAVRAVVKAHR